MMTIGTEIKNGKVVKGYLTFSSGKKVELTPDEWEECEQKLRMIEINGKHIGQGRKLPFWR